MKVYLVKPGPEPDNHNNEVGARLDAVAAPRPLVIVVAEPQVHHLLAADADFDVHAESFGTYEAFLTAARNRQVPLDRAPVVVVCSDALPATDDVHLSSLLAMLRDVAVVVAWNDTHSNGVIEVRGDVTLNTLRRAIAARTGLQFADKATGDIVLASPVPTVAASTPEIAPEIAPEPVIDLIEAEAPAFEAAVSEAPAFEDEFVFAHEASAPSLDLPPAPPFTPDAPLPEPTTPVAPPRGPLGPKPPRTRKVAPKTVARDGEGPGATGLHADFWDRWVPGADGALHDNGSEFDDLAAALSEPDLDDIAAWQPRSFSAAQVEEITGQHAAIDATARPFDLPPTEAELNGDLFAPAPERDRLPVHQAQIIAVYSPKGGVGKTSIAVNLASRLAMKTNLQVCIVDLDLGFGNVGTRLGLFMPTVRELLAEGTIDNESVNRNLAYDPRTGLHALLAPLRPEVRADGRFMRTEAFDQILKVLADRFDVIILDCPVELTDPIVSQVAFKRAHRVAMVLNNEQATLIDARRAIESMCRPVDATRLPGLGLASAQIGIVVNQKVEGVGRDDVGVHSLLSGEDATHPAHGVPIIASIPDDRVTWVRNANLGRPVATDGMTEIDTALDCALSSLLPGAAELLGVPAMVMIPGVDDVWADAGEAAPNRRFARRKRA